MHRISRRLTSFKSLPTHSNSLTQYEAWLASSISPVGTVKHVKTSWWLLGLGGSECILMPVNWRSLPIFSHWVSQIHLHSPLTSCYCGTRIHWYTQTYESTSITRTGILSPILVFVQDPWMELLKREAYDDTLILLGEAGPRHLAAAVWCPMDSWCSECARFFRGAAQWNQDSIKYTDVSWWLSRNSVITASSCNLNVWQ